MDHLRAYPLYLSWIVCLLSTGCGPPVDQPDAPSDDEAGRVDLDFTSSGSHTVRAFDCDAISAARVVDVEPGGFAPERTTIEEKTIVEWRNRLEAPVTVTSGDESNAGSTFDSGDIGPGESYCFEFRMTGTFHYFDEHRGSEAMSGVVRVEPEWR